MGDSASIFGSDSGVGSTIALLEARLPAAQERRRELEEELAAVTAQIEAMSGVLEGLRALAGTPLDTRGEPAVAAQLPSPTPGSEVPEAAAEADAKPAPAAARTTRRSSARKKAAPAATVAKKATSRKPAARKTVTTESTEPEPTPTVDTDPAAAQPTAPTKKATARTRAVKNPKATTSRTAAKKAPADKPLPVEVPVEVAVADVPAQTRRRSVADADSVLAVLATAAQPLRAREVTEQLGLEPVAANVGAIRTQLERLTGRGRAQRPSRGLYSAAAEQPATSG
ncbi:hypothetical protein ACIRPK_06300 [Kitasatospora sp. NPDC101801]|uniref:hypothetical protein n=1 Tax=Kitasatospora sp. NPDC101801 TaxID=3364103 RepID=UPI0037FFCDB7